MTKFVRGSNPGWSLVRLRRRDDDPCGRRDDRPYTLRCLGNFGCGGRFLFLRRPRRKLESDFAILEF